MGSLISKSIRNFGYFIIIFVLAFGAVLIKPTQIAKAGDPVEPTPISSCAELQAVNTDLTSSFIQTASFSCIGVEFTPIGDGSTPFTGIYDGGNFEITNLTITSDASMIGLFGKLGTSGPDGTVQNVKLVGANVTGTNGTFTTVGALVGMNRGTVTNSSSAGTVLSDSHHTGGLVGYNTSDGTITGSHSTANVTGTGDYTGGLAGENGGSIIDSYAEGTVYGSTYVGGLIGSNNTDNNGPGTITGSHASGSVTGTGNSVGGLAGDNYTALIELSYATGNVSGGDYHTGGLVGYNTSDGTITGSHSTANVTGNNNVGGLVGSSVGVSSIQSSYATGIVGGGDTTGGLVGYNDNSTIELSYATGDVAGTYRVGGLVGVNDAGGDITQSFAIGLVTGAGNRVGGLVGSNNSSRIYDTYAKGNVTGSVTSLMVGGLVGANDGNGSITKSYATGVVAGLDYLGGLVGANRPVATVSDSYYDALTGQTDTGKGLLTTTGNMKLQNTYQPGGEADWNFSNPDGIWGIDTSGTKNNGYPYFQWQIFDETGPTFEELSAGDTRVINITEGQTITTNPYTIYVKPTDGAGITKVEFYIDNVLICTDTTADVNGYYSCQWDTSKYHSDVKIIAYDALGNSTTLTRSTTVNLTGVPNTGLQSETYVVPAVIGFVGLILLAISLKRQLHEKKR